MNHLIHPFQFRLDVGPPSSYPKPEIHVSGLGGRLSEVDPYDPPPDSFRSFMSGDSNSDPLGPALIPTPNLIRWRDSESSRDLPAMIRLHRP
jgi:hypothetical protein